MLWRLLGADHPMEAHKLDSRAIYERGRSADAPEGCGEPGVVVEGRSARTSRRPPRPAGGWGEGRGCYPAPPELLMGIEPMTSSLPMRCSTS